MLILLLTFKIVAMKLNLFSISTLILLSMHVNAQNSSPYWSLAGNNNVTSSSKFGTTNNYSVRFYTNNTQRMIINSPAGLVGIGTTTPTDQLHVNSAVGTNPLRVQVNGYTKLFVHSAGGVAIGATATPPANGLYVSGNVGIGTKTPTAKLQVSGNASIASGLRVEDYGIVGYNSDGYGIEGRSRGPAGVYGISPGDGVVGDAAGYGVYGSGGAYGIGGHSTEGYGGYFTSDSSYGMVAAASPRGFYAGVFYGNVYTSGTLYQSSDKNLKTNIQEFGDAMSIINKLKPKNYEFKKDNKFASLNLPAGSHYGLLAQDLQEVLPNLVSETPQELRIIKPVVKQVIATKPAVYGKPAHMISDEKETKEIIKIKGVNYTELIPILVKGMQELSKENEDLKNQINDLKTLILKNGNSLTITSLSGYIKQNAPNPSYNNTIINYYIPNEARNAQILLTDVKGSVLKSYNVSRGQGQVNIKSGELIAGTYNYTLYINNSKIDTKQMVIIK